MPRLLEEDDETMTTQAVTGMQPFQFSGKRIEHLGATEYTLATVAVDLTGSVEDFKDDLRKMLVTAVESCQKSPRKNNLLLRVIFFSTSLKPDGIEELHGFKPLGEVDTSQYPVFIKLGDSVASGTRTIRVYGSTNLYDASFSAIGASNAYGKILMSNQYLTNAICIVVTDGDDNSSSATPRMIKDEIDRGVKGETLESMVAILVGINASQYSHRLKKMADEVGMQYVDAGDATPGKLAKLADFVSQSVSSQSQSIGTGGPSQNIAVTI